VIVTQVASGMYLVDRDGEHAIIYVAGSGANRWILWNGRVFRGEAAGDARPAPAGTTRAAAAESLTAPMPARVVKVLVAPGAAVRKGETVIVLEAMKMELPIRAPENATVGAVHCEEGELVQADAVLIELLQP
jgi:biotin carboxyl carrier protein